MSIANGPAADDDRIRSLSRAKYRRHAAGYDDTCGPTWPIRERAVAALGLRPGMRVLDVGCGTGLSLPLLRQAVADEGRVWGVEHSPEMAARALQRVAAHRWDNVAVVQGAAQRLVLPEPVDAMLFHYTHDVVRSRAAVRHLLSLARPGATVAVAGMKYFEGWLSVLNPWVYLKNAAYNGRGGELRTPWDIVAAGLEGLRVEATQFGMGYLVTGRLPGSCGTGGATSTGGASG
jgi:demethylmenaquinone methyltransferase/2-methoxy-6-polyprenyl-1,4-benzoquinol methylase